MSSITPPSRPSDDLERRIGECLDRGDFNAAAELMVQGYGPAILGYLFTLVGDDDARDVFCQSSEDIFRGLPGFRRECSARAWAYRLAYHAAARFRRDPFYARGQPLPTSAASRLAASVIASSMLPGGRRDQLRKLRETLSDGDQTLLVLRIDKELEWEEIAAVLSEQGEPVTAAALRKRFERLKAKLAVMAREQGLLD